MPSPPRERRLPWRRRLVYGLIVAAVPLVLLEGIGRITLPDPRGSITSAEALVRYQYDPTVPILTETSPGTWTFTVGTLMGQSSREQRPHGPGSPRPAAFRPQSWETPAADGAYRLITVGDSTIYGPLPNVIAAGLVVPGHTVDLLNFGYDGVASPRVVIAALEALDQDPDLLLVYVGHNEVAEYRRNPDHRTPMGRRALRSNLVHSGIGRLLRVPLLPIAHGREALSADHQTPELLMAAMQGALGDDEWDAIGRVYRRNLDLISRAAARAGVPLALVDPISSLRTAHDVEGVRLDDPHLDRVAEALAWCEQGRASDALALADTLDPETPGMGAPLLRGRALLALDRPEEAVEALTLARRLELMPSRSNELHFEALARVAEREGVHRIPTADRFLADPRYLAGGDPLFIDEVHPTADGNFLLADTIVDGLQGVLPEGSHFDADRVDRRSIRGLEQLPEFGPRGWQPGPGGAGAPPPDGQRAPSTPSSPP